MAAVDGMSSRRRRVFASVFPTDVHSTATPEVSPYIGAPASPAISNFATLSVADEYARRALTWSVVTRWLSLADSNGSSNPVPDGLDDALRYLFAQGGVNNNETYKELVRICFNTIDLPGR